MNAVSMGAALVPSALLMWFFHSRDANPEPAGVVWKTFFLGVAAIIPVTVFGLALGPAVRGIGTGCIYLGGVLDAFIVAAIPEEFFKYQVLSRYCLRHEEFNEPMDGMVYGVAASLGFATMENILYVADGGLEVAFWRALTAVPGHAMMGAIMGYFAGQAVFRPERPTILKIMALGWPILLHGLYDAPLMILNDTVRAGTGLPSNARIALLIFFAAVLLAEVVWAVRLVLSLRSAQLKEPKVPLGARWQWVWFRIIFGGTLATISGLMLLFFVGSLLENGEIGGGMGFSATIMVTVAVPGFLGALLFQRGLKGKRTLDVNFET